MMRTTFSRIERDKFGQPTFVRDEILGRAFLGWWLWALMADLQRPMTSWLAEAWAKAVRRNPRAAIEAFNRGRPDVDVDLVLKTLGQAKRMEANGVN